MKKIFTLFAGLLLACGSANAQGKWQNLVVNGDMEGEQDPKWSSFWCHDWRKGLGDFDPESEQRYDNDDPESGQFQGFAEIVEDPANPKNHCARVVVRSDAEAQEAGNRVEANGALASWDCQFFIYGNETIPQGKEVRMTLKVKGEKAGSFETQAHWKPGDYNHYQLFGNVNFTTEWQTIEVTTTVNADQTQEANGKFFQSVAFNLSTTKDGNIVYFDDVKLEIRDPQAPAEFEGWFNFLRNGTLSEDKIGDYTNFTGRDGATGQDVKARIVTDPVDGEPALNVTSIGFNAQREVKTEITDEEGNPVLDEEGNPTYETSYEDIYIKENGDTLTIQNGGFGIDNWQTQFFVTIPHKLVTGQKIKVTMHARADIPATIESQIHGMPGSYIYWQMLGNLDLTEEWQTFEFEDIEITSDMNGGSTIAFNCNVLKEVNNYYFRFDDFSINVADVTDNDRVLAKGDLTLPVPSDDSEAVVEVDMSEVMATLGVKDLVAFINDNTMKVAQEEGFSGELQATTGAFVDANGWYIDDEKGINFMIDEEKTKDNIAAFSISNVDAVIENGSSIETKIVFEKDGWYYQFNVRFIDKKAYDDWKAGIHDLQAVKPASGIVYDLLGRKVAKAGKGLFIKDGKKVLLKK